MPVRCLKVMEEYAPPAMPMGITLRPRLNFDFRQFRMTLSTDALTHLQSHCVKIRADRQTCVLEILPIYVPNAPGAVVQRTGLISNSRELMQWLRMDFAIDSGSMELIAKPFGVLAGDYKQLVSRRASDIAKTVEKGDLLDKDEEAPRDGGDGE